MEVLLGGGGGGAGLVERAGGRVKKGQENP